MKKAEMAEAAENLVADKAWLPVELRTPRDGIAGGPAPVV
jgi:hypothetical protein